VVNGGGKAKDTALALPHCTRTGSESGLRCEQWSAFHPRARTHFATAAPTNADADSFTAIHSSYTISYAWPGPARLEGVGRRPSLMLHGMVGISGTTF